MSHLDRPRLRPGLEASPEDNAGETFIISDRLRLSTMALRLSRLELECVQLLDGTRTLRDLQTEVMRWTNGQIVPLPLFERLVSHFEAALFLDGPGFRKIVEGDVRPASCIGCYPGEADELRAEMRAMFLAEGSSGLPRESRPDDSIRAALLPHIDYARGGRTYTWAMKEIVERSPASLFVIIGTSHYSRERFTLTRKHFETPLGVIPTDQRYIDRLVGHYGDGLFDDEWMAHFPEHSIELEAVMLQYLFEGNRDIRIVPLVVGSFHDAVVSGRAPAQIDDIAAMVEALRVVESEIDEPICYLISGDLAHIGPKFGDGEPVHPEQLAHSRARDESILQAVSAADSDAYLRVVADEADARRICGLPPTLTVLEAIRPSGGRVLHYDQYVHPQGFESVSFASAILYR